MIVAIVIVLVLALLLLFVDWSAVLRRYQKRASSRPSPSSTSASPPAYADPFQSSQEEVADASFYEPAEQREPEAVTAAAPAYQPTSEVEQFLSDADIHFRKGEMKAAEKLYLQAAALDPRCSKAYSRLGVIYLETGENYDDAEAAFRQALKTDPSNGYILNNLGLVLYHQDKYADAIRQFELAVRQDEHNASRHANLGMAYMAMRQYAKAESSFKKALKLAPNELEYKDLLNESIEKKKAHKTMIRR